MLPSIRDVLRMSLFQASLSAPYFKALRTVCVPYPRNASRECNVRLERYRKHVQSTLVARRWHMAKSSILVWSR
eukprot:5402313-Pleurochrysis_carterae.AAC.5